MMTNAKRPRLWRALVADYRASGLTVREWCERNGVTDNQSRCIHSPAPILCTSHRVTVPSSSKGPPAPDQDLRRRLPLTQRGVWANLCFTHWPTITFASSNVSNTSPFSSSSRIFPSKLST